MANLVAIRIEATDAGAAAALDAIAGRAVSTNGALGGLDAGVKATTANLGGLGSSATQAGGQFAGLNPVFAEGARQILAMGGSASETKQRLTDLGLSGAQVQQVMSQTGESTRTLAQAFSALKEAQKQEADAEAAVTAAYQQGAAGAAKLEGALGNLQQKHAALAAETKSFSSATGLASGELGKLGEAASTGGLNLTRLAERFGVVLSAGLALRVIKDVFTDIISKAEESERVLTQTNAVLSSTHGVAGQTAASVSDLATSLSRVIPVDDEVIQSAENMLLTFTHIGKEVFPQATEAALNMSVALGQGTKESAIQLGKALQDPIDGVTALRRVGVQLTDAQEAQIKAFVASGDVMSAQKIILAELTTEFGNSARAAGTTATGQLKIFETQVGNLEEAIGDKLTPRLVALAQNFDLVANKAGPGGESLASFKVAGVGLGDVLLTLAGIAVAPGLALLSIPFKSSKDAALEQARSVAESATSMEQADNVAVRAGGTLGLHASAAARSGQAVHQLSQETLQAIASGERWDKTLVAQVQTLLEVDQPINVLATAVRGVANAFNAVRGAQEGVGVGDTAAAAARRAQDEKAAKDAEAQSTAASIAGDTEKAASLTRLAAAYRAHDQLQQESIQREDVIASARDAANKKAESAATAATNKAISEAKAAQTAADQNARDQVSAQDSITKASTAGTDIQVKNQELLSFAFLKKHEANQQSIADETAVALASRESAQAALASWTQYNTQYLGLEQQRLAALQAGDTEGAKSLQDQAERALALRDSFASTYNTLATTSRDATKSAVDDSQKVYEAWKKANDDNAKLPTLATQGLQVQVDQYTIIKDRADLARQADERRLGVLQSQSTVLSDQLAIANDTLAAQGLSGSTDKYLLQLQVQRDQVELAKGNTSEIDKAIQAEQTRLKLASDQSALANADVTKQAAVAKLAEDKVKLTLDQATAQERIATGVDATIKNLTTELGLRQAIDKLQKDQNAPTRLSPEQVGTGAAPVTVGNSPAAPTAPNRITVGMPTPAELQSLQQSVAAIVPTADEAAAHLAKIREVLAEASAQGKNQLEALNEWGRQMREAANTQAVPVGQAVGTAFNQGIGQGVTQSAPVVWQAVAGLVDPAKLIPENYGTFIPFGKAIDDGIAAGIDQGTSVIAAAMRDSLEAAMLDAQSALGIASPSKVAAERIGLPLVQGVAAGIMGGRDLVGTAMAGLGGSAWATPSAPAVPTFGTGSDAPLSTPAGGAGGGDVHYHYNLMPIAGDFHVRNQGDVEQIRGMLSQAQFAAEQMRRRALGHPNGFTDGRG